MAITSELAFETGTDAFNARDLDRFANGLADDVVFQAPGAAGEGKAACVRFFGGLFEAFSDAHLDVHGLYVFDDLAVEEGTFTGTHDGVAHTGRAVELDYVQVLRHRDGKHVSVNLMLDRLQMLEQLGLTAGSGSAGALA
jgi:ketosteroid isomerase-like protein